ncbi:GAF domain-containing sensor histidine kinase [Desulfotomaculum sp. 1211_IL3151]|uniref:GAF domain-containing sensor histidine kinase n=1 Tax=Desulfotomaculum sp. 1211_IL3151 TaxID=3084055 RepID=UPI002FD92D53
MDKTTLNEKLLTKLTGVRSTRLNHYVELRKTIEEVTKQNKRLEIINEIARNITVAMSYEEIIDRTAEPLKEVISYDLLSFCLLEGEQLIIKSGIPKDQVILGVGTVLIRENSAPWQAMEEKRCIMRQNIWEDSEACNEDKDLMAVGIRSVIMAPLLINDTVIGTLNFGSKKTDAYSPNDFIFAQQLADQLAVCLQNSRLYLEVLKRQEQLVQTAKLAAVGEMAAGVAHELNSPLTAILGDAQLLLRRLDQEHPGYHLLADIKNCGTRCKRIIQSLLAFSRHEPYSKDQISLNEVVENSLALVSYQIEKNNTSIRTDLCHDLPLVLGNKQQLEQVLVNFLLNAKDALRSLDQGVITIRTGCSPREADTKEVVVSVQDNGCGIEPETMSKLFDPFFTTKELTKGTGLGLSVSLGIARSHGGRIVVQSEPGQGSTFRLIIPYGLRGENNG